MRNVRPALSVALPLVAAALVLTGCGGEKEGTGEPVPNPAPGGSQSGPTSSAAEAPSSAAADGGNSPKIDPCSLATSADLAKAGTFGEGTAKVESGAPTCHWTTTAGETVTVKANVWDSQGLADIKDIGGGSVPGKVNETRPAVQQKNGANGCVIAMETGPKSRVDVNVATDASDACQVAGEIATIVEPKLPKG